MNLTRVRALVFRYWIMYSRNTFRLMDVFFWPLMDLLIWGFVSRYLLQSQGGVPAVITFLIGAVIFWDILFRSQQAVTVSFCEDIWSGNLLNLFVAPIKISEFIASTFVIGLVQSVIILAFLGTLARMFDSFDLLAIGWNLAPFFVNLLLMGWTLGMLTTGLIIRWGQRAEVLAWAFASLLQPISAVFYPVSVLPAWLQPISWMLPSTHVFEGMRQILANETLSPERLIDAFALNAIYMFGSALFFRFMFNQSREKGLITKLGT